MGPVASEAFEVIGGSHDRHWCDRCDGHVGKYANRGCHDDCYDPLHSPAGAERSMVIRRVHMKGVLVATFGGGFFGGMVRDADDPVALLVLIVLVLVVVWMGIYPFLPQAK